MVSEINKIKKDLDDLMKRLELEAEQQRLKNNTANITRDKIKFMASEIVRGMTNANLDISQKAKLSWVAENVLTNQLIYKAQEEISNNVVESIKKELKKQNTGHYSYNVDQHARDIYKAIKGLV